MVQYGNSGGRAEIHRKLNYLIGLTEALVRLNIRLLGKDNEMAKTLDELVAQANTTLEQVRKNTDLDNSIIGIVNANTATIKGLKDQLAAAGNDPTKLAALSDAMDAVLASATSNGQLVADAVTANTPAA